MTILQDIIKSQKVELGYNGFNSSAIELLSIINVTIKGGLRAQNNSGYFYSLLSHATFDGPQYESLKKLVLSNVSNSKDDTRNFIATVASIFEKLIFILMKMMSTW
jgi:hypothetical protein